MKRSFLIILAVLAALNFACEDNNKNDSSIKIHNFSVIPENDTVPCKVYIIISETRIGAIRYLFIHEGAYLDQEFTNQKDSTQFMSMSTEEVSSTDTIEIYYNSSGNYKITLEVNSKVYEDDIVLYSEE